MKTATAALAVELAEEIQITARKIAREEIRKFSEELIYEIKGVRGLDAKIRNSFEDALSRTLLHYSREAP